MRFALTQKALTFLMAGVAAAPLLASGEVGFPFVLGFALIGGAGWFLEPPLTRDPRFRRAVLALTAALLAVQIARILTGAPVARAIMEYAVALLALKLASRGGAGDYQQVTILAFLHVIAATVVTFDLGYALFFAAFVALSAPVLLLTHLRREMERRFLRDNSPESRRAMERLLASRRVVSPRLLLGTVSFAVPLLLFTALLFLSFPRFGLGFLGRLPGAGDLAGFAGEVRIGDLEDNRRDTTVVLRLEPLEPGLRPSRLPLKLRGAVFDLFEDGAWRRGDAGRFRRMHRRGQDHPLDGDRREAPGGLGFDVLLESIDPPYLFLPRGAALITTTPVARMGLMRPRDLAIDLRGVVRYDNDTRVGLRYRVYLAGPETDAGYAIAAAGHAVDPDLERAWLALPPGHEDLADLARTLAGEGTPSQRARNLERGLRAGFRYADALETGEHAGDGDTALERFLFSRGTGTCEHFATALTLMLRAEGIVARLVTGFGSAEWNRVGEFYAVRLSSAHAWTEARLDGRWVTLDATPAREGGESPREPSTLALWLDTLRMRWHRHVVGYDAAAQIELARGLGRLLPEVSAAAGLPRPSPVMLPAVAAGVVLLVAGFFALRRLRRRLGPARPARARRLSASSREATRLYLALEARLVRLGFPRQPGVPPLEHIRFLGPVLGEGPERICIRYNEVRFGGRKFEDGEPARLAGEIQTLSQVSKFVDIKTNHDHES